MNKIFKILTAIICLWTSLASAKPLLDVQHWQTQQGTPVYFVATHELPMLDIIVGFYAGSSRDGSKLGLASLTNNSLAAGTAQLNADAIAEQFSAVGAQFDNGVNKDMATVSLRSLTHPKELNSALATFLQILGHPLFPDSEVKRERDNLLTLINYQQQRPDIMAKQLFDKLLYDDHPYANSTVGTISTVAKLEQRDVKAFYQHYYTAQNAVLILVGDQSLSQAKTLAQAISNHLPNGPKAPALKIPDYNVKTQFKELNFPSEQTHIIMGQMGVSLTDPNYVPLAVGNYIFGGGGLSSMLFEEIRKKRGLTYGATSQFSPLMFGSSFMLSLATRNLSSQQAISASQTLLQNYGINGPNDKQLQLAKQFLLGNLPLSLASNSAIANALLKIATYQLPIDFYDNYRQVLLTLDKQTITKAWQAHITPAKLITVKVGQHVK